MTRYRLAIFDIDGTLVDTEGTGVLSLMRTIKELMGIDMEYSQAYKYFGIPSGTVAGKLGYQGDHHEFAERWEENFVALSHLIVPFEGVEDMLLKIKQNGIVTGIVTSRNRFELSKDTSGLLKYFDHIVSAEDAPRPKPFPDPILKCLELCNTPGINNQPLSIADCIYLGDTEHDWQCARDAGCDFALADWKHRGTQGIPARWYFTNTKEALEIFGL